MVVTSHGGRNSREHTVPSCKQEAEKVELSFLDDRMLETSQWDPGDTVPQGGTPSKPPQAAVPTGEQEFKYQRISGHLLQTNPAAEP